MKKETFYRKMDSFRKNATGVGQIVKSKIDERRSDKDYSVLKTMNATRDEPDFDMNGNPTRGNMARTVAEPIMKRLKKKK